MIEISILCLFSLDELKSWRRLAMFADITFILIDSFIIIIIIIIIILIVQIECFGNIYTRRRKLASKAIFFFHIFSLTLIKLVCDAWKPSSALCYWPCLFFFFILSPLLLFLLMTDNISSFLYALNNSQSPSLALRLLDESPWVLFISFYEQKLRNRIAD